MKLVGAVAIVLSCPPTPGLSSCRSSSGWTNCAGEIVGGPRFALSARSGPQDSPINSAATRHLRPHESGKNREIAEKNRKEPEYFSRVLCVPFAVFFSCRRSRLSGLAGAAAAHHAAFAGCSRPSDRRGRSECAATWGSSPRACHGGRPPQTVRGRAARTLCTPRTPGRFIPDLVPSLRPRAPREFRLRAGERDSRRPRPGREMRKTRRRPASRRKFRRPRSAAASSRG